MVGRFVKEFKSRWNQNRTLSVLISVFFALIVAMSSVVPAIMADPSRFSGASQATGIGPGKIRVENYRLGDSFSKSLLVYNGHDVRTSFTIKYRYPDWVGDGFSMPSPETPKWVTIYTDVVTLDPHEGISLPITLLVPRGATVPSDKWEFWIAVIDQSQSGNIVAELAQRWIVTMK